MLPMHANSEDLPERVSKLEVQNRRWKCSIVLLSLLGISFVVMGSKPADRLEPGVVRARVVEAEDFILKDANGHVYARLTLNGDKKHHNELAVGKISPAVLEFYDENGDVVSTVPPTDGFLPVR
jgi:hypothetical protein